MSESSGQQADGMWRTKAMAQIARPVERLRPVIGQAGARGTWSISQDADVPRVNLCIDDGKVCLFARGLSIDLDRVWALDDGVYTCSALVNNGMSGIRFFIHRRGAGGNGGGA